MTAVRSAPARVRRGALRESELARLWQEQRLPPEALVTTNGEDVRIVYRGRRGAGAGPDFRDAIVAGPGIAALARYVGGAAAGAPAEAAVRGDVELHVRASDFRRHGHHLDRAYRRLVLHVVFIDDAGPTLLLDGRTVPTVALERWVQRRAGEIRLGLADPEVYREPCHTAVTRLGAEAVTNALAALGGERLRAHADPLRAAIEADGPEQALYAAIARGLGLTRNSAPMEQIARVLPLAELRELGDGSGDATLAIEGALLGAGGLLDGQLALWPGDARDAELLAAWRTAGAPTVPELHWAAGPQRPGCGPRERLQGLTTLVLRAGPPLDATRAEWRALLECGPEALIACLQAGSRIGRDRAIELAVNAVLPWLLAAYAADADLVAVAGTVYAVLPAPATYGQTRLLASALAGSDGRSLVRGALAVQGALQLHRDWCTQGGCGHCPLS